ncbi:MAG: class I SAM-dependent methyltransferase [Bacteroidota bacterium]
MVHRPMVSSLQRYVASRPTWVTRAAVLGLVLVLAGVQGCGSDAEDVPPSDGPYEYGDSSRDGIGKFYYGREISQVMGHRGAGWLERPSREVEEFPNRVVQALDLDSTDVVADIGVGTGYFTFRISPQVPRGRVLAVDIQPEMLSIVEARMATTGATNVEPILGTVTDPNLPAGEVDVVLMVDAYHEFSHPHEMMTAIEESLRPGGRVVLVEYRGEDPTVPIKPLHKMTEAQVKREMAAVGLEWLETRDFLPQQHFFVFRKPAAS